MHHNYVFLLGCIVTGFGQTSFTDYNAPTSIMKQVHVPIVDMNTKCVPSFTQILRNPLLYLDGEKEVCAGGQSDLDACTVSKSYWWFVYQLFGIC